MPQLFDVGRIGRDAELRYTPNGDPVINLAIACEYGRKGQDGKRPTQWLDASLWGKQAEALAPYLLKGQQVAVTLDDVHVEEFQRGDGSTGSKLVGRVSQLKLVGSPPQASGSGQQHPQAQAARQPPRQQQNRPAPQSQPQQPTPDYDSFDDDIPFAPIGLQEGRLFLHMI
jgi:single-strand DNA-binding protein